MAISGQVWTAPAKPKSSIESLRRKPRGGERLSFAAIAEKLNSEGIPTRQGKPWRASVVQQICKRS
ncbi:MAG: recombinase family protein [Planctomycetota bacterium]|nr:recombinase family protein [Planctomycetota bacterium]MDA1213914.1 recombinase family protein [Planctomycetota bacterium]